MHKLHGIKSYSGPCYIESNKWKEFDATNVRSECNNRHEWLREWVMGEKKRKRMRAKKKNSVEFSLLRHYFCVSLHWNVIIYDFMTCRAVTMYEGYGSAFTLCFCFECRKSKPLEKDVDEKYNMFFWFSSERRCAASTNVKILDCIRSCSLFFALLKIARSSNRRYVPDAHFMQQFLRNME